MSRKKILTPEELQEARRLKEQEQLSNRKIAERFEVGKTTIWDNVFATVRRKRIQGRRPKYGRCSECGILHNDRVLDVNNQLGGLCLGCAIQHLKQYDIPSKHIAEFMNIDLALVNKYWFIIKKEPLDLNE